MIISFVGLVSLITKHQSPQLLILALVWYLLFLFALWLESRSMRWHLKTYKRKVFQLLRNINTYQDPKLSSEASPIEREIADFYKAVGSQIKNTFQEEKQFTQNASHELQTPITVIKSAVDAILQSPNLQEVDYQHLEIILKNTNKLSRINNALVLLSRIRSYYNENVAKVHVNELVRKFFQDHKEALEPREIVVQYQVDTDLYFEMNENLAEILITNLLQNAIKHNIKHGIITVTITESALRIKNTGKYMDQDPTTLFQRFSKASNQSDSLGLGLSIVKTICEFSGLSVDYHHKNAVHELVVRRRLG